MKCYQEVTCPCCGKNHIKKAGKSECSTQRYRYVEPSCPRKTLMLTYKYKAYEPGVKKWIIDMTINSRGIRDISRVLGISKQTVINTLLRIEGSLVQVNPLFLCNKTQRTCRG